ncbi:MAG: META domain-containing protein [Hyphomonadaceae bacterium]|nr:META domain-containing protein [Hyphomonadaceae bacterium]
MRQSHIIAAASLFAGLAACQAATAPGHDPVLTASIWRVEDINQAGIMDFAMMSLEFGEDGRISGLASCNTYSGSYTLGSEGEIEFGPLATTRKLCPGEAIMLQEQRFLDALQAVDTYAYNEFGALVLSGPEGKSVLALPVD